MFVSHMKTATVRELRNNFASLAKWIQNGEKITITRNGETFATLSPALPERRGKVDWAARMKKYKPVGRKVTRAETDALWSRLRD
jgi:antitoxin (DNA-binding transcriptional repressor) of toxin-antitoxin stability system